MPEIILIADSGATKTAWCLISSRKKTSFYTGGISPYHMTQEQIADLILKEFPTSILKKEIDHIYYYGTGCYTKPKADIVKKALLSALIVGKAHVTHDLLGAARAVCGNEKGIACILGTGSNSCLYSGKTILHNSPGLGYVLGDEGSGAYLGKKVIQYYLYQTFDPELMKAFEKEFQTNKAEILHKVYKKPLANRYLAGFTTFLSKNRGHYMIENILEDGLRDFFEYHLVHYKRTIDTPIHFVGSIAYVFKDKIDELCSDYGMKRGVILKQPMDGLIKYHNK